MKRQIVGTRQNEECESPQSNETKRLKVFHPQELLEAVSGSDTDEEYSEFNGQEKGLKHLTTFEESYSVQITEGNSLSEVNPNCSLAINETNQEISNHYMNGNHGINGKGDLKNNSDFVISDASAFETYSDQNQLAGLQSQSLLTYSENSPALDVEENLAPEQFHNNQINLSPGMQISNLNDFSESERNISFENYGRAEDVSNGDKTQETFNLNINDQPENVEKLPLNVDNSDKAAFCNEFDHGTITMASSSQPDHEQSTAFFPSQPEYSQQDKGSYIVQSENDQPILVSPSSQPEQDNQNSISLVCPSEICQEIENVNQQPEHGKETEALAEVSEVKVDVENITFCELKVTLLEGHADVVFCVDVDEEYLVSSSGDTTVKVWNVEQKKVVSNFAGHNASVTAVVLLTKEQSEILRSKFNISTEARIAVSASYDCHVKLWSVVDGHEIASMYTFNSITCIGYLPDLMYVVVGTEGGKLEVWDLCLAKIVHFMYAHESALTSLKVHDGYIYTTSKDGAVKVWLFEEEELQPLYTRRRKEHNVDASYFGPTQWQAVAVHNDLLFLGDSTRHLKVLDWRLGRLRLMVNQPDEDGICESTLTKDNILLSTFYSPSSDTGGINVWRLPDLTYVGTLTGDLQEICSLSIKESGEKLRIVSGGHQLLVWDFDFSKPPNKNVKDPFFVCEVENVGSEVNEESISKVIPIQLQPTRPSVEIEDKKSWCNIS